MVESGAAGGPWPLETPVRGSRGKVQGRRLPPPSTATAWACGRAEGGRAHGWPKGQRGWPCAPCALLANPDLPVAGLDSIGSRTGGGAPAHVDIILGLNLPPAPPLRPRWQVHPTIPVHPERADQQPDPLRLHLLRPVRRRARAQARARAPREGRRSPPRGRRSVQSPLLGRTARPRLDRQRTTPRIRLLPPVRRAHLFRALSCPRGSRRHSAHAGAPCSTLATRMHPCAACRAALAAPLPHSRRPQRPALPSAPCLPQSMPCPG
jgi:hypothetical protein